MLHGNVTQGAFALLHEQTARFVPFDRVSNQSVIALDQTVPYHIREKRPLFIFDGELPQDGTAKASRQIFSAPLIGITEDENHQRKIKSFELQVAKPENIQRRFLVMPQGVGVGIRFREKSFAFRYVCFEFKQESGNVWKFTSSHSTY